MTCSEASKRWVFLLHGVRRTRGGSSSQKGTLQRGLPERSSALAEDQGPPTLGHVSLSSHLQISRESLQLESTRSQRQENPSNARRYGSTYTVQNRLEKVARQPEEWGAVNICQINKRLLTTFLNE